MHLNENIEKLITNLEYISSDTLNNYIINNTLSLLVIVGFQLIRKKVENIVRY